MTLLICYSTSREDVLTARKKDMSKNAFVEGCGQAFADRFGATAMFTRGFATYFAGVTFKEGQRPAIPELWTKPNNRSPLRRPKETGIHKKHQLASQALRLDWNTHMPVEITQPRESEVLKTLGVTKDQFDAGAEIRYFERRGIAYVACSFPLEGLDEIKVSDYLAALALPEKE